MGWSLGGRDPLGRNQRVRPTDRIPHWHYVSSGLTSLYVKESVEHGKPHGRRASWKQRDGTDRRHQYGNPTGEVVG